MINLTPIKFEKDGFFYDDIFYTYQAISRITDVCRHEWDDYCDERLGCCTTDAAYAHVYYMFKVYFADGTRINIGDGKNVKLYKKVDLSHINKFFRWIFNSKYERNSELDNFVGKETDEMKEYKIRLGQLRDELIEHFRSYREAHK